MANAGRANAGIADAGVANTGMANADMADAVGGPPGWTSMIIPAPLPPGDSSGNYPIDFE